MPSFAILNRLPEIVDYNSTIYKEEFSVTGELSPESITPNKRKAQSLDLEDSDTKVDSLLYSRKLHCYVIDLNNKR